MDPDELKRMMPPWKVFPEISPDDISAHTRQGRAEPYFDAVWRPFWSSLSAQERTEYFDHWAATAEWREAMTIFDLDPDLDLEADARESEAYLTEWRRQKSAQPSGSIWRRLLRRRQ